MAYKVSHRLQVLNKETMKKVDKDINKQLKSYIKDNEDISWVISEGIGKWGEDDRSFTNSEKHMCEFSKTFPELLFILDYDPIDDCKLGEVREYWFNGKCQYEQAEVVIAEFDESKLK